MEAATRRWIRRLAPWVITGAVVAAILTKYSLRRIYERLVDGDTLALVPFAIALPLTHILLQAVWDRWVINGGSGARLSYFDVIRGRAGSAVLLTLGFAFASGGYGLWIARKTGCSARTAAGIVLYLLMSGLIALCVIAGIAVWTGGADLEHAHGLQLSPTVVGVIAPLVAGGLVVMSIVGPNVLGRHRRADRKFLAPWANIPPLLFIGQLLGRSFDIFTASLYTWLAARAFGLDLPLAVVLSYFPIIILVGSLPINVAGFGAVQAAWLVFEPWAAGEQILAFQFVWQISTGIAIILRGLPFLRGVLGEIERGAPAPAQIVDQPS